jgi:hypothetical protein
MNFSSLIKIAAELEESGYPNYANDIVNEAVQLQNNLVKPSDEVVEEIPEEISSSDVDKFIGAVFYNLASHNNIKFNNQGQIDLESVRAIVNSFEQELLNADMS